MATRLGATAGLPSSASKHESQLDSDLMDDDIPEISETQLDDWLSSPEISDIDKLFICLALEPFSPTSSTAIWLLARKHGWSAGSYQPRVHEPKITDKLHQFKGLAIENGFGFRLTSKGKKRVKGIIAKITNQPIAIAAANLREILDKINSPNNKAFVEEAISNIETGAYRSAVILSWVGAIAVLQDFVVDKHLRDFNTEAQRIRPKWKDAKNSNDLRKMQECDFLLVIWNIGMIDKGVRQELEKALTLRNGCGHPSGVAPGKSKVQSHVEDLVTYVFSKF